MDLDRCRGGGRHGSVLKLGMRVTYYHQRWRSQLGVEEEASASKTRLSP